MKDQCARTFDTSRSRLSTAILCILIFANRVREEFTE